MISLLLHIIYILYSLLPIFCVYWCVLRKFLHFTMMWCCMVFMSCWRVAAGLWRNDVLFQYRLNLYCHCTVRLYNKMCFDQAAGGNENDLHLDLVQDWHRIQQRKQWKKGGEWKRTQLIFISTVGMSWNVNRWSSCTTGSDIRNKFLSHYLWLCAPKLDIPASLYCFHVINTEPSEAIRDPAGQKRSWSAELEPLQSFSIPVSVCLIRLEAPVAASLHHQTFCSIHQFCSYFPLRQPSCFCFFPPVLSLPCLSPLPSSKLFEPTLCCCAVSRLSDELYLGQAADVFTASLVWHNRDV